MYYVESDPQQNKLPMKNMANFAVETSEFQLTTFNPESYWDSSISITFCTCTCKSQSMSVQFINLNFINII